MTAGINGRAVADALAKEPDRDTSVELFTSAPPVETVAPGSTPVGSSPPTPPPDDGQLASLKSSISLYPELFVVAYGPNLLPDCCHMIALLEPVVAFIRKEP